MDLNTMIERISKNVGCDTSTLSSRMDAVLSNMKQAWLDAGKSEEDCNVNALRIAGRQIKSETDKLKRSGATLYEGMFVSVPRYKDWADFAYKKAAGTLAEGNDTVINTMVESGNVILYTDNNDGTFTKKYNPSLLRREAFEEGMAETDLTSLPKNTYDAGNGLHFHLVWDKVNPTFPSGDNNFKYGAPRPLSEKDRSCLFLGRVSGSKDKISLLTIRLSGKLAEEQFPTFISGTVAGRPGRDGTVIYGKAGVTAFQRNDDLQGIFGDSPDNLVWQLDQIHVLENGLQDISEYMGTLSDKEKWDALCALQLEVVHIDPRDNGGFIVTVGDLDIMSTAGTVDIYVPAGDETECDFGVGSTLLVVGSPWISKDEEARLSVTGWWCAESIDAAPVTEEAEGWD